MDEIIKSAVKRIPQLRGKHGLKFSRLGGLTNLVFHVKDGADNYVLRIPRRWHRRIYR